ncbi:hypothetical protein GCK72_020459 [Caenorhabditis remanei]|uniref:Uncharacterized protein n=1 Tax=Caenorhabditis remanei TaxID=31234 RepID=A0A6A5GHB7_CAERE|nr:hypothetical protein GCK72_020459 [Caenorhabditis remanei]KAF1753902.1 hypothetical protein GCK72_020459 [Caenorhabditis remanei]
MLTYETMAISTMNLQQLCLESHNLDKSVPLKIVRKDCQPSKEACEHFLDKTKVIIQRYSQLADRIRAEVIEENMTKAIENFKDAVLKRLGLPLEIYQLFKVPTTHQFLQEYRANIGRSMKVLQDWQNKRQIWSDKLKNIEADSNDNERKASLASDTQLELDCLTYFEVKELWIKEGRSLVGTWNWWKNTIHHNFYLTFKMFHYQWPAWLNLNAFQNHVNAYNFIKNSLNSLRFDWNSIQSDNPVALVSDFDREIEKSRDMMSSFGFSAQVGPFQEATIAIAE